MARIEIDVDDELLGRAALALGTQGAEDTVLAALRAAARPGPRPDRGPYHPLPAPGDPVRPPGSPPPDFPRPPEIR